METQLLIHLSFLKNNLFPNSRSRISFYNHGVKELGFKIEKKLSIGDIEIDMAAKAYPLASCIYNTMTKLTGPYLYKGGLEIPQPLKLDNHWRMVYDFRNFMMHVT